MSASPPTSGLVDRHVVVVGAGGIGCPAAWAFAEAGVGRLTIVDPDTVALSNLPRQVLYRPADVGRPKAVVAAERLQGLPAGVVAVPERLDDANEERLLTGADVLLDATDGALTKDWLNLTAVRRRIPFVHAAGLRSEGRILDTPPGGRPCLACLFGRLEDEAGSCADHGVWGGVVGTVGFLAAAAALERLHEPDRPSRGYQVLDLEGGRAVVLGAEASAACPVCGAGGPPDPEPYPGGPACEAADLAAADASLLDLSGESCPMNLLRARQAVEALDVGTDLVILLGAEGRESVPDGLRALGHDLLSEEREGDGLRLLVRRSRDAGGSGPRLDRDVLLRFARQVVLPDVGEAGQRRLLDAEAALFGRGPAFETAASYLSAAGVGDLALGSGRGAHGAESLVARLDASSVGRVRLAGHSPEGVDALGVLVPDAGVAFHVEQVGSAGSVAARPVADEASPERGGRASGLPAAVQRALGAMLAHTLCRAVVHGSRDAPRILVRPDGTMAPRTS